MSFGLTTVKTQNDRAPPGSRTPPAESDTMSLMNVPEDLSGMSRTDLVYKAKLAEQAERLSLIHI